MNNQELRDLLTKAGGMRKQELQVTLRAVITSYIETNNAISEREKADEAEKQNVARWKDKYEELLKNYLSAQKLIELLLNRLKVANSARFSTSSESAGELTKRLIRCTRRYFDSIADEDQRGAAVNKGLEAIITNDLASDPIDEDAKPDPDPVPDDSSDKQQTSDPKKKEAPEQEDPGDKKRTLEVARIVAGKGGKKRGKRTKGFQAWIDSLQHRHVFVCNQEKYDEMYGKGNWHFDNWIASNELVVIPVTVYVKTTYYPVIAPNDLSKEKYYDKAGDQPDGAGKLKLGSLASASLLAFLISMKFEINTALYTVEQYFKARGWNLNRGWMSGWINDASRIYFYPVVKYLQKLMLQESCTQCDETPWEVIRDDRGPGSKSYFWVHTSSELTPNHRKIVYGFELTRATEHLRKFYGPDYDGVIEDDAFSAYFTYENESKGKVTVANCYMHLRRRFVRAFLVIDKKGLTIEQLEETVEGKVIKMIGEIYRAENPLKKLTPEERLEGRKTKVKPLVEDLFKTLHETDVTNPAYSSYLVDAVKYALNHEPHFKVFLSDPLVPIDNGFCERSLRCVSRGRASFLFSTSVTGAEASAACYSLIETAKANNTVPDIYLNYLLEELPKRVDQDGNLRHPSVVVSEDMSDQEKEAAWDQNWAFLETMMPWSGEYQTYEAEYIRSRNELFWQSEVKMPHVHKGEVVYKTITEEEAAKYDRRRQKRMKEQEAQKEADSSDSSLSA